MCINYCLKIVNIEIEIKFLILADTTTLHAIHIVILQIIIYFILLKYGTCLTKYCTKICILMHMMDPYIGYTRHSWLVFCIICIAFRNGK